MRETAAVTFLLLLGCGRAVLGDVDDAGGDVGTTAAEDDGQDDAVPEEEGGFDDEGPQDEGLPDDGVAEESDGELDDGFDDGPVEPACWTVENLFTVPSDRLVQMFDQDGDGQDELWVVDREDDGGPGPGPSTIFSIDQFGATTSQSFSEGPVFGFVDGDGNGLFDLLTASFSGPGNPPVLGFRPGLAFGVFADETTQFDIDLSFPLVGFVDVTGDQTMDYLLLNDENLELFVGDGLGGFNFGDTWPLLNTSSAFVTPIPDTKGKFAVRSVVDPDQFAACFRGLYTLFDGSGQTFNLLGAPNRFGPGYGTMYNARDDGMSTTLYVDACEPMSSEHGLATLVQVDTNLEETVVLEGMAWVSAGDFDGDGVMDALTAEVDDELPIFLNGIDGQQFADPIATGLDAQPVVVSTMAPGDLDGDGREEVIRAIELRPGDPATYQYQRVFLGPCN